MGACVVAANGYLDTSTLHALEGFAPIDSHAGGLALPEVAVQWALMRAAYERDTGLDLPASEGYRPFATQVYWKQHYAALGTPQYAAAPGYSNHGLAVAIDAGGGAGTPGSVADRWLDAHAAAYGFARPYTSGSLIERWHLLYTPGTATITNPVATAAVAVALANSGRHDVFLIQHDSKGRGSLLIYGGKQRSANAETVSVLRGLKTADGAPLIPFFGFTDSRDARANEVGKRKFDVIRAAFK